MEVLPTAVYWVGLFFWFGLAGLIAVRLLSGRINTRGLLYGVRGDGNGYLVQSVYSSYSSQVARLSIPFQRLFALPTRLPDVPGSWIAVLGGSHLPQVMKHVNY